LQDDANAVIREILTASAPQNPALDGITFERLQDEGSVPLAIPSNEQTPFARGIFRTPSGKVEMYSEQAIAKGYDPVPGWVP
jgi:hypothetical protein